MGGGDGREGRGGAVGGEGAPVEGVGEDAPRVVDITHEPVELHKVLKFEGLVGSGGEAKGVIDDGAVRVNGTVERRRRRKLLDGDVVAFAGTTLRLRHGTPEDPAAN